jgi:hypothetical protein
MERKRTMKWIAFGVALIAAAATQTPATQAALLTFTTSLSGAAESPPNASPGTGTAIVTINDVTHNMLVQVDFSGLIGTSTNSHIHCCTANPFDVTQTAIVATKTPTFPGFPSGVASGTYHHAFDLLPATATDTYNAAFVAAHGGTVAGAEAALIQGLEQGRAYLNVHSSLFPAGEIRGFLQQVAVPEPSSLMLLAALCCGMITLARHRRSAPRT